ncbi:hypothetical protein ACFSGJ_10600 [Halodurantibacterium flavum]|uniref:Uncharacterized protein n=2 Tax=Halodurantibacterium flavum TaxID=1382802 RepID=A0ABW4S5M6_9RHOB
MQELPNTLPIAGDAGRKSRCGFQRPHAQLASVITATLALGLTLATPLAAQQDPATGYPLPPDGAATEAPAAPDDAPPAEAQDDGLSAEAQDPGLASEGGLDRPGNDVADWLPPAIDLPEDTEVVINSAIGSSTRLLQFSTHEDAERLIERWREALRETGWQVDPSPEMIESQQILFSGPGIGSAQVIIIPSQADGAQVIQIDASLNLE